jgi:anaerobic selenocysteine-containing dehydrogenase
VELYSSTLAAHGYDPLPAFEEPPTSPRSRPDLADRFPLVLSGAKSLFFCETQHRQVAALRKSAPDPQLEMHPTTAATRDVGAEDWVALDTPAGSIRARLKLNPSLDPGVVVAQHGWWQACDELGLPGYPPYGTDSANLNLVLRQGPSDPVSGSPPERLGLRGLPAGTSGRRAGVTPLVGPQGTTWGVALRSRGLPRVAQPPHP